MSVPPFAALPPADDSRVAEIFARFPIDESTLRRRYSNAFEKLLELALEHANGQRDRIGVSGSRGPNLCKVVTIDERFFGDVKMDLGSTSIPAVFKAGGTYTGTHL